MDKFMKIGNAYDNQARIFAIKDFEVEIIKRFLKIPEIVEVMEDSDCMISFMDSLDVENF